MKKFLLFFLLLVVILAPQLVMAALVTCGNPGQAACGLEDIFTLIADVFNFIILYIATPLATLMIMIGGILLLISGGNPGMAGTGKNMLKWSVIAIVLIWGSYLIIDTVLKVIGFTGSINPPF